jgi:hypothetical protein
VDTMALLLEAMLSCIGSCVQPVDGCIDRFLFSPFLSFSRQILMSCLGYKTSWHDLLYLLLFVLFSRILFHMDNIWFSPRCVPDVQCTCSPCLIKMPFHPNNIKKSLHFVRSETACDPASNFVFKFNQVYTDKKRNVTVCSTDQWTE